MRQTLATSAVGAQSGGQGRPRINGARMITFSWLVISVWSKRPPFDGHGWGCRNDSETGRSGPDAETLDWEANPDRKREVGLDRRLCLEHGQASPGDAGGARGGYLFIRGLVRIRD